MIALLDDIDDDQWEDQVRHRKPAQPTSKRVALAAQIEISAGQKRANLARYRRDGKGGTFNGSHRRRDKRNVL